MSTHLVKGYPLFGDEEPIDFAVPKHMDLPADRVANFLLEPIIHSIGDLHGLSILLPIFKSLSPHHTAHRQDGAQEGPAGLPSPRHTPGESTACLEDLLAPHIQLFLQSCKNGLRSPNVGHVVVQCRLEDLI
jgi:hypothetical protein